MLIIGYFFGKRREATSYVKYIIFLYYKMEPYCQCRNKIAFFRNGGKIRSDEILFLNGHNISIVDNFMYLWMLINYNMKFNDLQQQL